MIEPELGQLLQAIYEIVEKRLMELERITKVSRETSTPDMQTIERKAA